MENLVKTLAETHTLTDAEFAALLETDQYDEELAKEADKVRRSIYGDEVYLRGLIEFTNFCKNDCYYCGIRRSNHNASRYRLTEEQIFLLLRGGLGARLPHLRPAGRGRPVLHRRADLLDRLRHPKPLPGMRHHAVHRREIPRELSGVLRRGGESVSAPARDGKPRTLCQAPPRRNEPRQPQALSF